MNLSDSKSKLPLVIFALTCLGLGFFCIFAPQLLLNSFKIGYLWLLVILILALSPTGKFRLGLLKNTPSHQAEVSSPVTEQGNILKLATKIAPKLTLKLTPHFWLLQLFGIQIATSIVFWGLAHTLLQGFAIPPDRNGISVQAASQQTLYDLTLGWGLHPWPLALLIAIVLAYFRAKQGDQPLNYYATLLPLLKQRSQGTYALGCNVALRQCLYLLSACSFILILQPLANVGHFFHIDFGSYAMTPLAALTFIAIIACTSVSQWQRFSLYAWENYWSLGRQMLLQAACIGSLIMIFYGVAIIGAIFFPAGFYKPVETWLPVPDWQSCWRIFSWCWWLAATTLLSLWLCQIIKGQRIRSVIGWGLSLPSLWTMIAFFNSLFTFWQPLFINSFIAFSAITILAIYLWRSRDLDRLIMTSITWKTTLPDTQQISLTIGRSILQLIALIIALYLVSGLSFLHILCFVMIAPWWLFLATISLSAFMQWKIKT